MLVLASTLVLLSEKDLASRWGVKLLETENLAADSLRAEAMAERCDAVTAQYHLSPREDEICRLIAQGKTNAEIERELFIAPGTLKAHIQHIYVKVGVHSRKELVALCGGEAAYAAGRPSPKRSSRSGPGRLARACSRRLFRPARNWRYITTVR